MNCETCVPKYLSSGNVLHRNTQFKNRNRSSVKEIRLLLLLGIFCECFFFFNWRNVNFMIEETLNSYSLNLSGTRSELWGPLSDNRTR